MTVEITYLISLVFGAAGFASVVYNLYHNRKKDLRHDVSQSANITFELKALQTSLMEFKTEIRMAMEANNRMTLENHDKIIKLEADVKTAFIRIDEMKEAIRT